jgi:hypothetical protein
MHIAAASGDASEDALALDDRQGLAGDPLRILRLHWASALSNSGSGMSAMSGSGFSNKVLVATLRQRTSDKSNEYFSGFLGKARVIGFRGRPTKPRTQGPVDRPFFDDPVDDIGRSR